MQIGEYGSPEHAAATAALREKSENMATTDGGSGNLSSLQAEALILKSLGFAKPLIARMGRAAIANGTTIERELLTSGHVREEAYYEAMARLLRLPFVETIPETAVVDHRGLDSQLKRPCTIRLHDASRPPVTLIAPEAKRIDHLIERLQRFPALRNALAIATPSAIRAAAWRAGAERRVERSVNHLFEQHPRHSARIVMTGRQGFFSGTLLSLAIAFFLLLPEEAVLTTHIVLSLLYLAALQLRLAALFHGNRPKSHLPVNREDGDLPVYTVLSRSTGNRMSCRSFWLRLIVSTGRGPGSISSWYARPTTRQRFRQSGHLRPVRTSRSSKFRPWRPALNRRH